MRPSRAGNAMLEGRGVSRSVVYAWLIRRRNRPHLTARQLGALSPQSPGLGALRTSFGPPQR